MITDVCISIPATATYSLSDLSAELKSNGWARCLVTGISAAEKSETCIPAVRIQASSAKELQTAVRSAGKDMTVIVNAGDNSFNRSALTMGKVRFLAGLENLPKNGFDHITAKLAADKNVALVIELAAVIDYRTRKNALKAYADILALQRKYRFPLAIASGARSCAGIRTVHETVALCSLFGMERREVYAALEAADSVLFPPETVEAES